MHILRCMCLHSYVVAFEKIWGNVQPVHPLQVDQVAKPNTSKNYARYLNVG